MENTAEALRLKRHPEVRAHILPDGNVVLQLKKTDWVYILTPLGGVVWEFSDGSNSSDDIYRHVSAMQDMPSSPLLKQQIDDLVQELKNLSLLVSPDYNVGAEPESTISGGGCAKTWQPDRPA